MNYSIQILRMVASISVLLYHATIKYGQYYGGNYTFYELMVGVDIFFIISGYVMCMVYSSRPFFFVEFCVDRCRRIFPMYWIFSLVALIAYMLTPELVNSGGGETFVIQSFLLVPVDGKFLVNNGWTLSFEMYFYIVFAIVVFCTKRFYLTIPLIFIMPLFFDFFNLDFAGGFLVNIIFFEFAIGVCVYCILNKVDGKWRKVFLSLVLLGFVYLLPGRVGSYGLIASCMVILILLLNPIFSKFSGCFVVKYSVVLGNSSYTLYLAHVFTLVIFSKIYQVFFDVDSGIAFTFFVSVGSIVISQVLFDRLEKPLDSWLKERTKNRKRSPRIY